MSNLSSSSLPPVSSIVKSSSSPAPAVSPPPAGTRSTSAASIFACGRSYHSPALRRACVVPGTSPSSPPSPPRSARSGSSITGRRGRACNCHKINPDRPRRAPPATRGPDHSQPTQPARRRASNPSHHVSQPQAMQRHRGRPAAAAKTPGHVWRKNAEISTAKIRKAIHFAQHYAEYNIVL